MKGFVELGRWGEVDGLVAELVVARESGGGRWWAVAFDDASAELPLPAIGANDAPASFADRRPPPAAKRGQVPERAALGPSKKFWRVRPQGELQRSRNRQKLLRAEPAT